MADTGHISAEERAIQTQQAARLFAAMAKLPADQRIAFALHELQQLGLREIGEMTGTSAQTVWARVQRAKKEMFKQLAKNAEPRVEVSQSSGEPT